MRVPLLCALLLGSTAAHAVQGPPVEELEGTYDLTCASSALSIDLGLAWSGPGGSGSWGDVARLELACAVPERRVARWAADATAQCVAGGLPRGWCRGLGASLYDVLLPFADVGRTMMPVSMEVDVVRQYGLDDVLGVYQASTLHTWADGREQRWDYLLDNNLGPDQGRFVAFGIGLNDAASIDGAGCVDTSIAAVEGHILRPDLTVEAAFGINRSVTCLGALADGSVLTLTLGLTFEGQLEGEAAP